MQTEEFNSQPSHLDPEYPIEHSQTPLGKHFPLFKQESDSPALQPISEKENQLKIIYIWEEKLIIHV